MLLRNGVLTLSSQALHRSTERVLVSSCTKVPRARFMSSKDEAPSGQQMTSGVMYNWRVAAVYNALAQKGKATGALSIEDLTSLGHLDQYHYLGTEACDHLIETLGLEAGSTVLDVGAGIGGPARYIAAKSGCSITGVELQADLVEAATALTQRVGLSGRVKFLVGDFAEVTKKEILSKEARFDHCTSLLTFCHFPNRDEGLQICFDALRPGGTVFFEDLALAGPAFTEQESKDLRDVVGCPNVTSPAVYAEALQKVGFVDVEVVDMSDPWKKWTKARHEGFRAAKEETVKLHGLGLFESRCKFYEVIDRLYQGNLGGVRITARKPSENEAKLLKGRRIPHGSASSGAMLNEFGTTVASSSGASASSRASLAQPVFPETKNATDARYHDSLQYHFFFPGIFVAGRVFHTRTLQQHSAWMYNVSTKQMTELFQPSYETMAQEGQHLSLDSSHMKIQDQPEGGTFTVKAAGIDISFRQRSVFSWLPAGQEKNDVVIHRPDITCKLNYNGKVLDGFAYSKRYFGPYPRFWGYRFIHGMVSDGEGEPIFFWTADAAFGDNKYNYFKVLPPSGKIVSAESKDTWQQDCNAYAIINGTRQSVSIRPLCTWETVIGGPGHNMESKMQNRYCEVELVFGGRIYTGVAYNERCYGTVG
jgi:cyclopropane fatty-acyl-phospholipid synthase-like methyltransferase